MADEALMDVFINILPDKDINAHIDGMVDAAMTRIREKFGAAAPVAIKAPAISGGTTGGAGGTRGSGGSVGSGLETEFRRAQRAAEDLAEETRKLKIDFASIATAELDTGLTLAANEIKRLQVDIKRQAQDGDLLGVQESLRLLPLLKERVQDLRAQGGPQLANRNRLNSLIGDERENRANFAIESRLNQSLTRGQPSGQLRQEIAQATAEMHKFQLAVDQAFKEFDGGVQSIRRVEAAIGQVNTSRYGLQGLQQQARATTTSMNGLTNNAYQLGQAFEDAAVGFSLNGVAGAVRGASNNVSFLINNLVQAKAAAGQLTGAFARNIPLIAGVAVALGLIAPIIIDWIESLNDVDLKFEDISDRIKEEFANQDFKIGLDLNERQFLRSIESAKDLKEILESLKKAAQEVGDAQIGIGSLFKGFDESGDFAGVQLQLARVKTIAQARREELQRTIKAGDITGVRPFGLDEGFVDIIKLKQAENATAELPKNAELIKSLTALYEGLRTAREQAFAGTSDPKQLQETVAQFNLLKKTAGSLFENADLKDDKAFENFTVVLDAFKESIDSISKTAQEIENFNQEITGGLDAAILKTKEFTAAQDIVRKQIQGIAGDEALFVFEVLESSKAYGKLIEEIRTAALEEQKRLGGGDVGKINSQADALLEQTSAEKRLTFLQKEKEIRDKISAIKEKDRKSDSTNFASFASNLQRNVLSSSDKKDPLIGFERDLRDVIQGRRALEEQSANRRGVFAAPDPFDKRQQFNEPLLRELFKGLTDEMKKNTGVTEKLDVGARAQ